MSETKTFTGGCLCGAVRYRLHGPLRPVVNCHCQQCRRSSGHFVAATAVKQRQFELLADAELRWYRSSAEARRGFCGVCGSSLFWQPTDAGRDHIAVMAGTLDGPTGLTTRQHIFVDSAGDYYTLADGLPRSAGR